MVIFQFAMLKYQRVISLIHKKQKNGADLWLVDAGGFMFI